MKNLHTFVSFVSKSLMIKLPVEFRFTMKGKSGAKHAAALCETRMRKGLVIKHVIVFNMLEMENSRYNYFSVIAHELIHASMIENGLFDNEFHHNKMFQKLAEKLETTLRDLSWKLGDTPIYNPETDQD